MFERKPTTDVVKLNALNFLEHQIEHAFTKSWSTSGVSMKLIIKLVFDFTQQRRNQYPISYNCPQILWRTDKWQTQRGFLYRTFRHLWFVYLLFKAVTVKQSTQVKVGVLKFGCVRNVTTRLQLALLLIVWHWYKKNYVIVYVTNDVVMMKKYLYFPDLISQQITIICVWFGLKEGQNNIS